MSTIDPEQVHVSWHRDGGDRQVMIGLDGEDVKVAMTFPVELSRRELETILDERDREIDHYFEALARVRQQRTATSESAQQNERLTE
ncbi:hypothetical protein SAMN06269185_2841 [Natronoarchaeum philippinense]|uniref:Uncharacterized protein n=1 Tax=Natronoarchaeum philippinense TaxID=558529 RepID=A0A285P725_NATPI|nr:hypothetical protein [Natronoarchaeum philippinense]SNZ16993.1 hypothetical protein SAMN06269185_2841 [Natronoarchaeum philippinense]